MELNKNHRESLLDEHIKAKEELNLGLSINRLEQTEHFNDWQDIKIFLLQEKVKLIEKSLIDNEIDF